MYENRVFNILPKKMYEKKMVELYIFTISSSNYIFSPIHLLHKVTIYLFSRVLLCIKYADYIYTYRNEFVYCHKISLQRPNLKSIYP